MDTLNVWILLEYLEEMLKNKENKALDDEVNPANLTSEWE